MAKRSKKGRAAKSTRAARPPSRRKPTARKRGPAAPSGSTGDELAALREALADLRADARAARDEVQRLADENEVLRARLDERDAAAPPP